MISGDPVLVNIIKDCTASMRVAGISTNSASNINYDAGRSIQIISGLIVADGAPSFKNKKYPLIAMILPVREKRGSEYYAKVKIERLIIACLTDSDLTVLKRYEAGGTFADILYPCYNEFMKRLAYCSWIVEQDPDSFIHEKMDNPGTQQLGQGTSDYVDSLEILNLEFTLIKPKNC
jgi:hypothetical protein